MLNLHEALAILRKTGHTLPTEELPIVQCNRRILAEDILSDTDMPPFDKSAMDGYACRKADLANNLKVTDTEHAGEKSKLKVETGTCIRIMTGAPVPSGADTVVMIEDTKKTDTNTIRVVKLSSKTNICYRGEDVKKGDRVLTKGDILLPQHIAVLASVGKVKAVVYQLPEVALISTGSELVEPESLPKESQIRNSNAYNLLAQLLNLGVKADYRGIVEDDPEKLTLNIRRSLENNDILILTGGASMGEHDYVPKVLQQSGMNIYFRKLAIQPGKPVSFASDGKKYVFGLSGNPVSSFLQFELLIKPFIYKLTGHNYEFPIITADLTDNITRKQADRLKFFPVWLTPEMRISAIRFNGSAHIAGITNADGFGLFPKDTFKLTAGEKIEVLLIR